MAGAQPVAVLEGVTRRFGGQTALRDISATILPGRVTGLVGPDGAGKTTLLRLMAGLLRPDEGRIRILGQDPAIDPAAVQAELGYMPQRFGLYEDLSVQENLDLYAHLRGLPAEEREAAFLRLLAFTGLERFRQRLAGKLSGGMKQKLGLACALLRSPRLLLLDEPSVGVDPVSRRELWRMTGELLEQGIAVVWATAYLDEAERCAEVLLLQQGEVLFRGPPGELTRRVAGRVARIRGVATPRPALRRLLDRPEVIDGVIQGGAIRLVLRPGTAPADLAAAACEDAGASARAEPAEPRFEDAFVDVLGGGPSGRSALAERARDLPKGDGAPAIEAEGLTKRFGDFTAADDIRFAVRRGEVFGLLGPNGAGKSTTFRMLCGLLRPSAGEGRVAGRDLRRAAAEARQHLGYMAQKFSLYGDLTPRQNLEFWGGAYGLGGARARARRAEMEEVFDLGPFLQNPSRELPLGYKQRLALACAVLHEPEVLFLDEPTSGVDPVARREFWAHVNGLVEKGVTVLVTTHFMEEAEYCDRIGLIDAGRLIATGTPEELKACTRRPDLPDPTMEDAFIALLEAQGR
jgi:ABC-2 type transport system ATP-binding protein